MEAIGFHLAAMLAGYLLDLCLGDPHSMPHPVRAIGNLIVWLEKYLRPAGKKHATERGERRAGVLFVCLVLLVTGSVAGAILWISRLGGIWIQTVVEAVMTYYLLAARSLRDESMAVCRKLEAGEIEAVVVKDLSRLGRNSAMTGLYTTLTFPKYGTRFIAINDNYDTIDPNRVDNDFAGIKNWFNEFYARDTSRKIRAVQKAKGERGVPLTTNVPYGYVKDLENPRRWVVDPVAADVVKRIFDLCMKGRGPMQIANQLKADKVLTPSAYRALQGIKTPNKKPEDPCDWHSSTVVAILERREYTGCTVNFKTYTNSIWDKKQRDNPLEKQAIFPNTHEVIIEEAVFEKVQQVRQQRHRNTRTGRSSIFSGLVYCADCGEKLY